MAVSLFTSELLKNLPEDLPALSKNLLKNLAINLLKNPLEDWFVTSYRFKVSTKSAKKACISMFRDERGVLEPHADLLSVALAVIGFMVFAALMSQTYFGYEDRSFALENYESASLLAENLADAPSLKAESPGLLSAASLDALSGPEGIGERTRLFAPFSGNYRFLVEVRTGDGRWYWRIVPDNIEPEIFADGREKIAASVPVVIELNPAQSLPGILTVVIYKTAWT